jgi:hypothetical protein
MKKNNTLWLLLLALCSLFAACKKDSPQDELSKLPPATQTGANTFGCLVNGKAWVAQTDCKFLCDPAFKIYYDGAKGGSLTLIAVRKNANNNINDQIILSFDSTNYNTVHLYSNALHMVLSFTNYNNLSNCGDLVSNANGVSTNGIITLSHYNLQSGIVSGTFNFSLSKTGCETVNVTDGRFDYKL